MRCGACISPNKVSQPISSTYNISTTLTQLINKYHQYAQQQTNKNKQHPILSLYECKLITDLMASNNGILPQVRYNNKQIINNQMSNNQIVNQAGATYTTNISKYLLTKQQRIIWKCLLIISDNIQQQKQLGNIDIPKFKQIIQDKQQIVQDSFYQIKLDVNRTFPTIKYLNRDNLTLLLRNIVNTICGIGYTQGMNFYAGFFLLCGFTTQQAYYIIIKIFISPNFFIAHNFSTSFSQVMTCNTLLSNSLSQNLSNHLNNVGIVQQIYSFSWFLCSYLYTFDIQICAIIWDWIIKSGVTGQPGGGFVGVINISIGIMQKLKEQLQSVETPDGVMGILRPQNIKKVFNQQQIIEIIEIIKTRSLQFIRNPKKYTKKQQNPNKFRKLFVTKDQLYEIDNQSKKILTIKQLYQKYMNQIFGWSRSKSNNNNNEISKLEVLKSQQVIIVGNPNIINSKQNNQD